MSIEIKEYKNAKYNEQGNIDLEINHPTEGWIPYTLDMDDHDNTIDNVEFKKLVDKMDIAEYVHIEVAKDDNIELDEIIESL